MRKFCAFQSAVMAARAFHKQLGQRQQRYIFTRAYPRVKLVDLHVFLWSHYYW